jgi:two-component system, cell cycle sensor histidine kinase and response regulator CckA
LPDQNKLFKGLGESGLYGEKMKSIKSKLLVCVGLSVFIFSAILFYRTYTLITANVENLTNQQLSLALDFDLAIRGYVAEKVRPLMFNLVADGEFKPEAMSTSYVARNIFNKVRTKYPDYIIKFSAENPRNPVNQAGPEELNMIQYFNKNPKKQVWTGAINLGNKSYFAKFSAMRMERSCLRCHGNPADAPAELLEIYGSKASFNLPLGEIIGLDMIAIPKEKVTVLFFNDAINNFTLLGGGLFLLCISLVFIFKFVITDRLSRIAEHFVHTEEKDGVVEIKLIDIGGQDEITTLTNKFNELANRLNNYYTLLEEKVEERTIELSKANEQLKKEIEERNQAETMLKRSENTLKSIFKSAPIGIGLVTHRTIGWTNDQFQQMIGYSQDELKGKNARILYESDDEYERIGFEMDSQIQKFGTGTVESQFKRNDGHIVDVLLRSAPINPNDFSEGRIFTVMDITQTKLMQDQLIRSERLAATGQLAASVAHEINSPLQAVTVMLGTLKKKYSNDEALSSQLELLKDAFSSIRDTVKNLLDLNRPGKEIKQSTNVNHIIEKNIDLFQSHFKKNKIRINLDLSSNIPDLNASPLQLNQCFLNLINNAVEAITSASTPDNGSIDGIETGGEIKIKTNHGKGNIIIKITDTGPGIPEEELQYIFDPFFTRKKKMGMGVGLSICYRIIEDHGGIITAENSPHGGVVMTITLPAY